MSVVEQTKMRQEQTLSLSNPDASLLTFLHQTRIRTFAKLTNLGIVVDSCGSSLIYHCTDSARTRLQDIDFIEKSVQSIIGAIANLRPETGNSVVIKPYSFASGSVCSSRGRLADEMTITGELTGR